MGIKTNLGEIIKQSETDYKIDFGKTLKGNSIYFTIEVEENIEKVSTSCGCAIPKVRGKEVEVSFTPKSLGSNTQVVTITDKNYKQKRVELKTYTTNG